MNKKMKLPAADAAAIAEQDRIAGAIECIASLAHLEHSAENLPESDDAAVFYNLQSADAAKLASLFGPLTPRQEGAFRALAEYIHAGITTGQPNLERWKPVVALTPAELQARIDDANSDQ